LTFHLTYVINSILTQLSGVERMNEVNFAKVANTVSPDVVASLAFAAIVIITQFFYIIS